MSYTRVMPRDMFNDSNLLKCMGCVYINLEKLNLRHAELEPDAESFDIEQNPDDGSTYVANVPLIVNGERYRLFRPLNSREPFPLYVIAGDEEISVFNDNGSFDIDFLSFIGA
jgi:hypothetical protein